MNTTKSKFNLSPTTFIIFALCTIGSLFLSAATPHKALAASTNSTISQKEQPPTPERSSSKSDDDMYDRHYHDINTLLDGDAIYNPIHTIPYAEDYLMSTRNIGNLKNDKRRYNNLHEIIDNHVLYNPVTDIPFPEEVSLTSGYLYDHITVYSNGIPLNPFSEIPLRTIPANDVEAVHLIQEGGSAENGFGETGINVILKRPVVSNDFKVSVLGGNNGRIGAGGYYTSKSESHAMHVGFDYSSSKLMVGPYLPMYVAKSMATQKGKNDNVNSLGVNFELGRYYDSKQNVNVMLSYGAINSQYYTNKHQMQRINLAVYGYETLNPNFFYGYKVYAGQISYEEKPVEATDKTVEQMTPEELTLNSTYIELFDRRKHSNIFVGLGADFDVQAWTVGHFVVGFDSTFGYNSRASFKQDKEKNTTAAKPNATDTDKKDKDFNTKTYLLNSVKLGYYESIRMGENKIFLVNATARVMNHNAFGTNIALSTYAELGIPSKTLSIYFGGGQGYEYPTIFQKYDPIYGNSKLKATQITSIRLGTLYGNSNDSYAKLELYDTVIRGAVYSAVNKDYLYLTPAERLNNTNVSPSVYQNSNDALSILGIRFDYSIPFTESNSFKFAGHTTYASFADENVKPRGYFLPHLFGDTGFYYNIPYSDFSYVGVITNFATGASNGLKEKTNKVAVPTVITYDAIIQAELTKKINLFIQLDNALDNKNDRRHIGRTIGVGVTTHLYQI